MAPRTPLGRGLYLITPDEPDDGAVEDVQAEPFGGDARLRIGLALGDPKLRQHPRDAPGVHGGAEQGAREQAGERQVGAHHAVDGAEAEAVLMKEYLASGESNTNYKAVDLLKVPWLA